jgi:hypothetical protein
MRWRGRRSRSRENALHVGEFVFWSRYALHAGAS